MEARRSNGGAADVEALLEASRLLTAVAAHSLATVQPMLTTPQLRVLVMLGSRGPLNLSAVASGLGINPSNASRTCEQLVAAALVTRRTNPEDRRAIELRLSAEGAGLVQRLMAERRKVFGQIARRMDPEDRGHLATGLRQFLRAAAALSDSGTLVEADGTVPGWLA